jgi:hypothetical protein
LGHRGASRPKDVEVDGRAVYEKFEIRVGFFDASLATSDVS